MTKDGAVDNNLFQRKSFFWTPDYLDVSAWIEHIPFAFWIIEVLKPKTVVELGVHKGTSYFAFCQAVNYSNINCACYGIDTWQGDEHAGFYEQEIFAKVASHNAEKYSGFSTLIRSTFDEANAYFIDGTIDLLHIDGLHTYEAVKHDFETWLPKLSPNAVVLFHDINVRERNFGVFKLWNELKQQYLNFQFDFGHGLGVITIGNAVQEELNILFDADKREAYYIFLRNLFSDRGRFFNATMNFSIQLKHVNEHAAAQQSAYTQLSDTHRNLEQQHAQLQENVAALSASNEQLQENVRSLQLHSNDGALQYSELRERFEALTAGNEQLKENFEEAGLQNRRIAEENKMLAARINLFDSEVRLLYKMHEERVVKYKTLQRKYRAVQTEYDTLQKVYENNISRISKELGLADVSSDTVVHKLAEYKETVKQLNEHIAKQQKIVSWYRDTYELRSLLGVIKEKISSGNKKTAVQAPRTAVNSSLTPDTVLNNTINNGSPQKLLKNKYLLKPAKDIYFNEDHGEYTAKGADPFFIVDLRNKRLPEGWYWLSIDISVSKGRIVAPKLYYDFGRGFNEEDVWDLPNPANDKIEGLVKFPFDIFELRFDPTIQECTFKVGNVYLKALTKLNAFRIALSSYKHHDSPDKKKVSLFTDLLTTFLKGGKLEVKKKIRSAIDNKEEKLANQNQYTEWCALYDTLTDDDIEKIKQRSLKLEYQPLFSIVMPVYNAPLYFLKEAIESVRNQAYSNWELCIADDKSTQEDVVQLLKKYQEQDDRIKVVYRTKNGHISKASNSALAIATGEYIVLLDQDDELRPHSLYMVARALNENKDLELLYSDEDKINERGNRYDPYFKTDWNKDLFYGQNFISHLGVYKHSLIKKVNGFREGYEGSQDYDLALRCIEHLTPRQICHIPHILYHWRATENSTAVTVSNKGYAFEAGLKALNDHLMRTDQPAVAVENVNSSYRVKWRLPEQKPLVSIIIPTKDKVDVLSTCVTSILQKTDYEPYEILIIDNNSEEPDTHAYYESIQRDHKQVKVYAYNNEFNFSGIVNYGVDQATGDVVLLMNNDTEVINEDWLSEMAAHCLREEIGAVGAKLYYPNGQIQHAGVFLHKGHPGIHIYAKREKNDPGYFNKLNLTQNYTAVTAACLAIRRQLYLDVGGCDDKNLKVTYNDVDLCLKVQNLGYRNLWTPFAELYHHESLSRGSDLSDSNFSRFKSEHSYMLAKWKNAIAHESYFNPNLSIETNTTRFAFPPNVKYEWQAEL